MKKNFSGIIFFLIFVITLQSFKPVNGSSVLDWIWGEESDKKNAVDVPLISIPFEMLSQDEQFLLEAGKVLTDIKTGSTLDICQHKIILKIQKNCGDLSEEDLSRLSIHLLNCQLANEGKPVFECTIDMSLKDCTSNMDGKTWNAYNIMGNRAKAVCFASRNAEFRALTEITINKLMETTTSQIKSYTSLKHNQDMLEERFVNIQNIIEFNIKQINEEKALILNSRETIVKLLDNLRTKLENSNNVYEDSLKEISDSNYEILQDLKNIELQTGVVLDKVESSTNRILEQSNKVIDDYEEKLLKIEEVNDAILDLWNSAKLIQRDIEPKLEWIIEYMNKTKNLDREYVIFLHMLVLVSGMIITAFLSLPFITRLSLLSIVSLNLLSNLKHGPAASLDFVSIIVILIVITAAHYAVNIMRYLILEKGSKLFWGQTKIVNDSSVIHTSPNFYSQTIKESRNTYFSILSSRISSFFSSINQQILLSIAALKRKITYLKQKVSPTVYVEETRSCSYEPSKPPRRFSKKSMSTIQNNTISEDYSTDSDNEVPVNETVTKRLNSKVTSNVTDFFSRAHNSTAKEQYGNILNERLTYQKIGAK